MAVVPPLGFSSVAVERDLRKIKANLLTPKGNWAVVLHVQPMGVHKGSRLTVGSVAIKGGGVHEGEVQETIAQHVIGSVSKALAAGQIGAPPRVSTVRNEAAVVEEQGPAFSRMVLLLSVGLVGIAAVISVLLHFAESR
jgi:hypothetical protein